MAHTGIFKTKSIHFNFTSFPSVVSTNMLRFHPSGCHQSMEERGSCVIQVHFTNKYIHHCIHTVYRSLQVIGSTLKDLEQFLGRLTPLCLYSLSYRIGAVNIKCHSHLNLKFQSDSFKVLILHLLCPRIDEFTRI